MGHSENVGIVIVFSDKRTRHIRLAKDRVPSDLLAHGLVEWLAEDFAELVDLLLYDYTFLVDGRPRTEYERVGDVTYADTIKIVSQMPYPEKK